MTEKNPTSSRSSKDNAVRIATVAAGAAIGSAAIAAAVLFASKHRDDKAGKKPSTPTRLPPQVPAPESD